MNTISYSSLLKLLSLLLFVLLTDCVPRYKLMDFWTGKLDTNLGLKPDTLSSAEISEYGNARFEGKWLIDYDYFSWIATDTLQANYNVKQNKDSITGYVVFYENLNPVVYFGRRKDSSFTILHKVLWGEKGIEYSYLSPIGIQIDDVSKIVIAQQKTINLFSEYYSNNPNNANTYAKIVDDKIIVYIIPALSNNFIVLCGGVSATFSKNDLALLSKRELHPKCIIFDTDKKQFPIFWRFSPNSTVINEVDYFQTNLIKSYYSTQYIKVNNHVFKYDFTRDLPEYIILNDPEP